jgi:hypothetical protein
MATSNDPDYVGEALTNVRSEIAVDDDVLSETKKRRNLVTREARKFNGATKTFNSGSVAHGDVNKPISDADGGVVLDRRTYPELGPDGDGVGPSDIVREVKKFILPGIRKEYPNAKAKVTKRAILVTFGKPLRGGQDPSVDLIVALTRKEKPGRWIPNTEADRWDASDPEKHTELLLGPTRALRVHRARVIRLAKAAIKSDSKPVISSFNIEALALKYVTDEKQSLAESLRKLFERGSAALDEGLTPDPAKVSPPIKLPEGITRATASKRLGFFGKRIAEAIKQGNDKQAVNDALADVFPKQLTKSKSSVKEALAAALDQGNDSPTVRRAVGAGAAGLKTTRAYGDETP